MALEAWYTVIGISSKYASLKPPDGRFSDNRSSCSGMKYTGHECWARSPSTPASSRILLYASVDSGTCIKDKSKNEAGELDVVVCFVASSRPLAMVATRLADWGVVLVRNTMLLTEDKSAALAIFGVWSQNIFSTPCSWSVENEAISETVEERARSRIRSFLPRIFMFMVRWCYAEAIELKNTHTLSRVASNESKASSLINFVFKDMTDRNS